MRVKIFKHTFVPREAMQLQPLLSTAASSLRPTASSRSVYKDQQREPSDQEPKQMGRRSWSAGNLIGKFFVERNLMMMMPVPFLMVPSPNCATQSNIVESCLIFIIDWHHTRLGYRHYSSNIQPSSRQEGSEIRCSSCFSLIMKTCLPGSLICSSLGREGGGGRRGSRRRCLVSDIFN